MNGAEIGTRSYLKNYEADRQKLAFPKVAGIDIFNKLYTDYDYPVKGPVIVLRTIAATFSNRIKPLKELYKKVAMN